MFGRRCAVSFYSDGQKCLPDVELKKGSKTKMPTYNDPLGDRRLAGWSCRGVVAVPNEIVTIEGDTEFKALWSTTKFKVRMETGGSGSIPDMTVCAGDDIAMPESEMPGYRLVGWSDGTATHGAGESVKVLSDMRFKAVWEKAGERSSSTETKKREKCVVTFDAGPEAKSPRGSKVKVGGTVVLPDSIKGAQGELLGWSDGKNRYDPGRKIVVTGDVTFKAVWGKGSSVRNINKIEVRYDARGGSAVGTERISPGESLVMPSSFMQGYELKGWRLGDEAYGVGESVEFREDSTLVAVWARPGEKSGAAAGAPKKRGLFGRRRLLPSKPFISGLR